VICIVYFFFSSRRRHTRFSRDWSSDVCSSDLFVVLGKRIEGYVGLMSSLGGTTATIFPLLVAGLLTLYFLFNQRIKFKDTLWIRSEERRVGKECRFWCGMDPWKKNREMDSDYD